MSPTFKNFLITFIAAILVFGIAAYFIVSVINGAFFGSGAEKDTSETNNSSESETDTSETPIVDDSFTMLLLGNDYQPAIFTDYNMDEANSTKAGFPYLQRKIQTDAIILLKADRINKRYVFISIPGDMNVTINGADILLKNVCEIKGIEYFCEQIYGLTGLRIDYYSMVSIPNLALLIDSMGGIDYNVPVDMKYTDSSEGLNINISQSSQKLDGTKAVQMLRYRNYVDGDVSRRAVGISFAKALFSKLATNDNLQVAANLYTDYVNYVTTSFTLNDLTRKMDIIFAFNEFETVDVYYPGTTMYDNNGNAYFEGNITEALSSFKQYK